MNHASITINHLTWTYPGRTTPALQDIDLYIGAGEKVLIMGRSGSGKSTLLSAIAHNLDLYSGDNLRYDPPTARCGMVLQDPDTQVMYSRFGDDIAFGCENIGLPRADIWARVEQNKKLVGLASIANETPTHTLSGGQKQRMAIAGVLAMQPEIMILDEPTANIDPEGVNEVYRALVSSYAEYETTTIIVEHNAEPWIDFVDRIIVLDQGKIIHDGPTHEILEKYGKAISQAGMWVPDTYSGMPITEEISPAAIPRHGEKAILTAQNFSWGWNSPLGHIEYEDYIKGSSTVITGRNGCGKSTYMATIAGLLRPLEGKLEPALYTWKSRQLSSWSGYVFQDPEHQFLTNRVIDELALGSSRSAAQKMLDNLGLSHLSTAHPCSLSGGEKRRLSVGTALIRHPELLFLDEPSFGLDRGNFVDMAHLVKEAQEQGTTLIAISHDQHFLDIFGTEVRHL